jgi:translin
MSDNQGAIEQTVALIAARMEQKNAARERALAESRAVIRNAANSIRALHRHEFEESKEMLEQGRALLLGLKDTLTKFPDIYYAGYVQDAQKEYTEARLTYALVRGEELPQPESLGVEDAPYINALAEAASELRRYILDLIRQGGHNAPESEKLLDLMDEVYSRLVTVDYPDVLTGGLRRTTDQLRGVLERTRGDLTITLRQRELELALQRAMQVTEPSKET